ncbi:MAG: hypothetical protein V4649_16100 [Bacteroidota bacterium]
MNDYPRIPLYVYDIDEAPYSGIADSLPIRSHGNGELIWLHDNTCIAFLSNKDVDKQTVRHNTAELDSLIT